MAVTIDLAKSPSKSAAQLQASTEKATVIGFIHLRNDTLLKISNEKGTQLVSGYDVIPESAIPAIGTTVILKKTQD